MIYSVLYGHLNKQYVKKGDKVVYGTKIGEMGNTGQVSPMPTPQKPNAGTHTHLAVVEGKKTGTWTLASMKSTNKPNKQQCLYFIEDDIFGGKDKTTVTCGWLGYTNHYAYDIIPKNRKHYDLYWNRSFTGTVSAVGKNAGYGNYVIVQYDTRVKTPIEQPKSNEELDTIKELNKQLTTQINALKQELERVKAESEQILIQNQSLITQVNSLTQMYDEQYVELNKTVKEKQVLEDKINLLEKDKPKLIFLCDKDGTYRIKLKQNYKLYIKN